MTSTRVRLLHAADLLLGHLGGCRCPNCRGRHGERVARKHGGLGSIYRCDGCGLLYRPTGLQSAAFTRWYYSFLYADDPAFTTAPVADRKEALTRARAAGKDRSALVERALSLLPPQQRSIGVLGASWGYELLAFERLGVPVWGIEPGDRRRAHGQGAFGLELYPTPEAAAAAGRSGGLIYSSHVLEHIGPLTETLDDVEARLAPRLSLHIVPRVDPFGPERYGWVGREHPIGVTRAFWRRFALGRRLGLVLGDHWPDPQSGPLETAALLGGPAVDLARFDARDLGLELAA